MTRRQRYEKNLKILLKDLKAAKTDYADTDVTRLTDRLIDLAIEFDLMKNEDLDLFFKYTDAGIKQDKQNPSYYDDPSILGAPFADDPKKPLEKGEVWNKARRATLSGVQYKLDERGYPQNPYHNRGMKGRGVMGRFGPNFAVDNGAVRLQKNEKGEKRLCVTGIIRGDSRMPAFAGGYADLRKNKQGKYYIDRDLIIETQLHEFFEEMISGSIPLEALTTEVSARVDEIVESREARSGKAVQADHREEIKEQVIAQLKWEQVQANDPTFLDRLRKVIETGRECYTGPVINDNRGTDNAWCETILTWFNFDDETFDWVKNGGKDRPRYDYQLAAGDDAFDLVLHDISPTLVEEACASHGPMFVFLAASYMLDRQAQGRTPEPSVMAQMVEIADYMDNRLKQAQKPRPRARKTRAPKMA